MEVSEGPMGCEGGVPNPMGASEEGPVGGERGVPWGLRTPDLPAGRVMVHDIAHAPERIVALERDRGAACQASHAPPGADPKRVSAKQRQRARGRWFEPCTCARDHGSSVGIAIVPHGACKPEGRAKIGGALPVGDLRALSRRDHPPWEGAHGRGDLRSIPEAANAGGRLLLQPRIARRSTPGAGKRRARHPFYCTALGRKPDLEHLSSNNRRSLKMMSRHVPMCRYS